MILLQKDHMPNTFGLPDFTEKCDPLNQCYSRIYTETVYNKASSK